jgi:hypothetical protein
VQNKCKDIVSELEKQISNIFRAEVSITPLDALLPFYITNGYDVQVATIYEQRVCLLIKKNRQYTPPPDVLRGQMLAISKKVELHVVLLFEDIVSYNIERMKQKGVNYIILKKERVHTPFLGVSLRKTPKDMPFQNTFLTPFAQFLLLYHLQKELLNGFTVQQLSGKFTQSYLMTSRAIKVLENFELCRFDGVKNKHLQFVAKGEKLWFKAQDFLQNPVERKLFTDQTLSKQQACLSNINALSEYSMLNDEVQQTYAVYKKDVKNLPIETNKHFGDNVVEVWRYDPRPLSKNGFVDKLSLWLLFKNDDDPRIQIELERRILKEMQWLED